MPAYSEQFIAYFDDDVRSRGKEYFHNDAVEIIKKQPELVKAEVGMSNIYDISLKVKAEMLQVGCSCTYFYDEGFCKHLWATLLKLDRLHFRFGALSFNAKLAVDPKYKEGSLQFDADDDEYYEEDDFTPRLKSASAREIHKSVPLTFEQVRAMAIEMGNAKYPALRQPPSQVPVVTKPAERVADWRKFIEFQTYKDKSVPIAEHGQPFCYFSVQLPTRYSSAEITIDLEVKVRNKNGWPGKQLRTGVIEHVLTYGTALEKQILQYFAGRTQNGYYHYSSHNESSTRSFPISTARQLLPLLAQHPNADISTGQSNQRHPLKTDFDNPWQIALDVSQETDQIFLQPFIVRGLEKLPIATITFILSDRGGGLFLHNQVCQWLTADQGLTNFFSTNNYQRLSVSRYDLSMFGPVFEKKAKINWPEGTMVDQSIQSRQAVLLLDVRPDGLSGALEFEYRLSNGTTKRYPERNKQIEQIDWNELTRMTRDSLWEQAVLETIRIQAGFEQDLDNGIWKIELTDISILIERMALVNIEVRGRDQRKLAPIHDFKIEITSGIDWFDLEGNVSYGDVNVSILELLNVYRKGEHYIKLTNDRSGMLPEQWLSKFSWLLDYSADVDNKIRFHKTHASVLRQLTEDEQIPARFDPPGEDYLKQLANFSGIQKTEAPVNFRGELREYQKHGLAWLEFLDSFGFGGILADDMGLGKTIQVLAFLLLHRKDAGKQPSLIVMPTSLIFNWLNEAAKFAPDLKLLNFTGSAREQYRKQFKRNAIILTTYGTMRNEIEWLAKQDFAYVILDEAQAMKNADSLTARAVRMLRARHRLALSGTPVENHLGELWSIMTFLNPGLLGGRERFMGTYCRKTGPEQVQLERLRKMVYPFILRRTKEEVLPELPPKTEQTIHCEMSPKHKQLYDEVKHYYRALLLKQIDTNGMNQSKMKVLEGLLRLRQIACHPALVKKNADFDSSKLETLLHMVEETIEEGHKVLLFSQFTSMLSIVRGHLDEKKVPYAYLDGRVRKREEIVNRFQNDPECMLFLISLKAGGLGLNLTAASYVFIYDPWWNPAVEMQAVDRAYRIGQQKNVNVYRLITAGTVEEKIIELQKQKKALVKSVIGDESSLFKSLSRDDIEYLFG